MPKSFFLSVVSCIFIASFSTSLHTQPMADPYAQLSPQDIENLNALNEAVGNMPPEEQAAFFEQVEKIQKNLEKMPEDRLKKFIDGSMSQEDFDQFLKEATGEAPISTPSMPTPIAPTPTPEPITPVKQPAVKKPDADVQRRAERIVKLLVYQIESILLKLQSYLDLGLKIERWNTQEDKKIAIWRKGAPWISLRYEIEKFVQRLRTLTNIDKVTKKAIYIDYVAQDPALLSNLEQLATRLEKADSNISTASISLDERLGMMSSKTKAAIRETLATLIEAIDIMDLPAGVDRVISKFEPEAKKLREQIAAIEKKAADEAASRPRQPGMAVGTYRSWTSYQPVMPTASSYRSPYPTEPYRGADVRPSKHEPFSMKPSSPGTTKQQPGAGKPSADKKPDLDKTGKEQRVEEKEHKLSEDIEDLLYKFDQQCERAAKAIMNNNTLVNLYTDINNAVTLPDETFQTTALVIKKSLGSAKGALDTLGTIKRKMTSQSDELNKRIKKRIDSIMGKYENEFEIVADQAEKVKIIAAARIDKAFWYLGQTPSGPVRKTTPSDSSSSPATVPAPSASDPELATPELSTPPPAASGPAAAIPPSPSMGALDVPAPSTDDPASTPFASVRPAICAPGDNELQCYNKLLTVNPNPISIFELGTLIKTLQKEISGLEKKTISKKGSQKR